MPSERRLLQVSPLGSWLLGPGDEPTGRLRVRVQLLLTGALVVANVIAMVLVVVLVTLVLPGDPVLTDDLIVVNFVVVPAYCVFALVVGGTWGTVRALRMLQWSIEDREATRKDRIATLRVPWMLTLVQAVLWAGGFGLFTLLYGLENSDLIAKVGFTIFSGGVVVCSNTYLLSEFALRPVAARALTSAPMKRARGVGITMRSLLIWLLGAVPVLGLMVVALFALAREDVTADRLAVCILALGGIGIVFGLLLMVLNTRSIMAPIRTVTGGLARVQRGDLDAEVLVFDGTELGMLQSGFNRMVHDVREREQIRELFGRHVGEDVARAAMSRKAGLGGEVRDVAVLFVDVVGSTTLAATRPPEEVVEVLNRFFAVVVTEVEEHGGFVNKFEGDAALAVFGAPRELDDPAGCALAAARSMARRLAEEVEDCQAGIGVAYGPAVAGNIGAESRFEYTVIGDPVNEGARLCEQAKTVDGMVAASMKAVDAASEDEARHWQAQDEVTLRGRTQATTVAIPISR